jgi:hypothetical protein
MLQKRALHIMKGVTKGTSCRDTFRELKIVTVTSLYILEVLSYSKKHNTYTTKNSDLYEYDTRRKENLHMQSCNTVICEKGVVNRLSNYITNCQWN